MTGTQSGGTDRPAQCPKTRVTFIFDAVVCGSGTTWLGVRTGQTVPEGMTATSVALAGDVADEDLAGIQPVT